MNTNDKNLQETRKLNQQSKQGNMTGSYSNSDQETKQLNQKSRQNKSK